jgi:hypothetical protein
MHACVLIRCAARKVERFRFDTREPNANDWYLLVWPRFRVVCRVARFRFQCDSPFNTPTHFSILLLHKKPKPLYKNQYTLNIYNNSITFHLLFSLIIFSHTPTLTSHSHPYSNYNYSLPINITLYPPHLLIQQPSF